MTDLFPEPQESKPLDFVCNQYLMYEAQGKSLQHDLKGIARQLTPIFVFIGSIIWLPIFSAVCYPWAYSPNNVWSLLVLLWLCGVVICFFTMISMFAMKRREFPTNILMNADGLRLGWRKKKKDSSRLVPWSAVRRVSATQKWKGPGTLVRMHLRFSEFSQREQNSIKSDLLPLESNNGHTGLHPYEPDCFTIQFPLDALTLEADRFRFISALKLNVMPEALTEEFNQLLNANQGPTYTQLWLDDMQSFRRARSDELQPGQFLQNERFEIKEKIASGGQATIYSALDHNSAELVALKELILPVHAGAEVRNRAFANVRNEAMLLASLDHPGIVKILDNFTEDHRAYLVLEHIPGKTLRHWIEESGPMPISKVLPLALGMCGLLQYLHTMSPPIVHRDFTPDNLMLSEDGCVRLLDFNVAQQLESNVTKTVVGKHNYMAPEQFRGKPCTQSDLYSYGCTLYYLLTGADPLPLASSRPSERVALEPGLDDIVAKLTAPALNARYKDSVEVSSALTECTAVSPAEQAPAR